MDNIQKETAIRRGASKVMWDDSITFQNIDVSIHYYYYYTINYSTLKLPYY